MIGLCDCNSFFASCERLMRPDLEKKPIVVLSNNDGIIVAADQVAKSLGFSRGKAWHEVKEEAEKKGVVAFSSNYTLYQDLSNRVMKTLSSYTPEIEQYSIDEAFFTPPDRLSLKLLASRIFKETGIPVSVGYGRTRTLVKIASKIAKKKPDRTFFLEEKDEDEVLRSFDVADVWGVGHSWKKELPSRGIHSAYDLKMTDPEWATKNYNLTLARTIMELNGNECQTQGQTDTSMCSGVSFKDPVENMENLIENLIVMAESLSRHLAEKNLIASSFGINFFSNRFRSDYLSVYHTVKLLIPTNYAPNFASIIERLVPSLFKSGYKYKGGRVFAFDLIKERDRTPDLFTDNERLLKEEKLSHVFSDISRQYGKKSLLLGSAINLSKEDIIRRDMKSRNYTTRFDELCEVY